MSDVIRVRIAHRSPLFQECLVAGLAKLGHFEVLGIDCRAGVERLSIVDKLRVSNRHQAVEYARQRRWLQEPERQIVVGSAFQPDERARPAGRPDLPESIYRA